jgi:outer membrane protein
VRSNWIVAPLLALMGCAGAWAQTQLKVAVIDMSSAMTRTKEGQKVAADLNAKYAPKQQEFQKRGAEIQQKQDEFKKKENMLSDDQKNAQASEISKLQHDLQMDVQAAQQDAQQDEQLALGGMSQKMQQVINKYAADKGLTMIFDVGGQANNLLFASTAIDITNEIVVLYDQAAAVTPSAPPTKTTTAPPAPRPAAPPAAAPKPTTPAPAH